MAELTVPQVDFSALGQLPQIYQQGRSDAIRRQTLANLGQGGEADAATLLKSGDLSLAQLGINIKNHQDELARQAATDARQATRDKVADSHWATTDARAAAAERRAAADYENTPDQYAPNPKFGQPGEPQYIDQYAQATAAAGSGKPVPIETLGGTKFMVRTASGYSLVDPSDLSKPQNGAPAQPQQAFPAPLPSQSPQAQTGAATTPAPSPSVPAWAQPPQAMGTAPAVATPSPQAAPDADTVDPQSGRREGYLQSLDPQVRDYVKKVADYEIDPRTTSVKGGMREKLLSAVAKYDPAYNQNDFSARSKAIKDFSTGPQGNIIRSFDVAIDHLDTLQKAATAMQNGDVRLLNQVRNAWRNQTGSDLPSNFQALVPLVSGEIAKAVIGSNNALSDREELRHNLQNSSSPDQIAGVITGYKGLMSGQLKGLRKQYEETTGKKDFNSRLREHTLKELNGSDKAAPVTIDGYTIKEN